MVLKCIPVSHTRALSFIIKAHAVHVSRGHTREIPSSSPYIVFHPRSLPPDITQIPHLLMTVTNAYWLHWMTHIRRRSLCPAHTRTLSPTLDREADCSHMTLFLWSRLTRWTWEGWKVCAPCSLSHALTPVPSTSRGRNTMLCSEVQYFHMCILKKKSGFVLLKHVYGLCVIWVAEESLSFSILFRHTRGLQWCSHVFCVKPVLILNLKNISQLCFVSVSNII